MWSHLQCYILPMFKLNFTHTMQKKNMAKFYYVNTYVNKYVLKIAYILKNVKICITTQNVAKVAMKYV